MAEEDKSVTIYEPVPIPDTDAAVAHQKRLENLALTLLNPEDFTYRCVVLGDKDADPAVFETAEEAEAFKVKWEKIKKKEGVVKVTKQTRKSGWYRLALHLGVKFQLPDQTGEVTKEIQPIPEMNMLIQRTRAAGYEVTAYFATKKTADGFPSMEIIRAEATVTTHWPAAQRSATRSGACSSSERNFAHPDHDVIAMAETRALCRSIAATIGFGDMIAEEFDPSPKSDLDLPPSGKGKKDGKEGQKQPQKDSEEGKGKETPQEEEKAPTRGEIVKATATRLGKKGSTQIKDAFTKFLKDKEIDPKTTVSQLEDEAWAEFEKVLEGLKAE